MIGSQTNFEQEENTFLSSGVLSEVMVNPVALKIHKSSVDEPSSGDQGATCNLQFLPETNAFCLEGDIFMSSLDTQWRLMSPAPCPVALAHYFQTLLSNSSFKFPYLQFAPSMRPVAPTGIIILANSAKSNGDTRLDGSVDLLESSSAVGWIRTGWMDGLRPSVWRSTR